jgi:hypothetical protein
MMMLSVKLFGNDEVMGDEQQHLWQEPDLIDLQISLAWLVVPHSFVLLETVLNFGRK